MPRLASFIAVLLLVLGSRPGHAFSLLGPIGQFSDDAWQQPAIGYNPPGAADIGAPKNIGEEYRWTAPILTYGFDPSFVNYFGSNGVAAVDEAFAILNSLPDLTTLSTNLDEYPLRDPFTGASTTFRDSRRINLRAEADNILDLRSYALGMIVEQLGLASPERWTWAIRDRRVFGNPPITNYFVVQRNFDPVTIFPSKYVNGNRYTYDIIQFNDAVGQFEDAIERTVDPEHRIHGFDSVANITGSLVLQGVGPGVFYTYLTRDDIGGLRYIYSRTNLNFEGFPPNTQIFTPDFTNPVYLTNMDLTLLSLRSQVSSPALLQSLYPGIIITQATPGVTHTVSNSPVVVTQIVAQAFTTNFNTLVAVSNLDLGTFSSVTLTSAPPNLVANLQAAFPGAPNLDQLVITSTNQVPTTVVQVASILLTNAPKQPWNDPFTTNFIFQTNYVTNLGFLYFYSFRNVLTNYQSPFSTLRRFTTGVFKEPWSDASNPIYRDTFTDVLTQHISGGVTIIPTNLLGYDFTGFGVTNVIPITNFFFSTNVVDLNTGIPRTVSVTDVTLFTNVQYSARPIELTAGGLVTNIFITNSTVPTNIVSYTYAFSNVLTNYAGPNTPALDVRYEVTADPANPAFNRTNIVSATPITVPVPSGGFVIDTNQTGFQFTPFSNVVVLTVTNTLIDFTDPNTGVRTVEELRYNFTNTIYLVFPYILTNPPAVALRGGVGKLNFQRIGGGFFTGTNFLFTNRYVAEFYANGRLTNASFVNVQTLPDFLFRAVDLGTDLSADPISVRRGINFVNNAPINGTNPNAGGPGTINGPVFLDFNKVGHGVLNQFPGFVSEETGLGFFGRPFVWGKFDGSTNAPIVFPQDISLEHDIELLITGGAVP